MNFGLILKTDVIADNMSQLLKPEYFNYSALSVHLLVIV